MFKNLFSASLVQAILGVGFLFQSAVGFAFPLPKGQKSGLQVFSLEDLVDFERVQDQFTANYNFEGIVALNNCSGSIVRFEHSEPTDKALILTNGHCVEMMRPGAVYYRRNATRNFTVLSPAGENLGRVRSRVLVYATMTKTDMAIYELETTYAAIEEQFQIRPLTFSNESPATGTEIEVISGYWKRGYSCRVEGTVFTLREGDWTFNSSVKYSTPGCEVIGGTSGSPVIQRGTRTVVAVNNTGNESGGRCTVNNPCEINEAGDVSYRRGWSYGQQTAWIYTCLDASRQLDLQTVGCLLPKPQ